MNDPVSELAMYKAAVRAEWNELHHNTVWDLDPSWTFADLHKEIMENHNKIKEKENHADQ